MTALPLYNIPKGSILNLDDRALSVTACVEGGYAVECQETGECFTIPCARVEVAIRERTCEVIKPADVEKRRALLDYTGGFERVEQFSEETRRIVQARLALVLAMDDLRQQGVKLTQRSMSNCGAHRQALLVQANKISPNHNFLRTRRGGKLAAGFTVPQGRTIASYYDTYHQFGQNAVVLADRDHLKGRYGARLVQWQERFIAFVLNSWMDKRKPRLAGVFHLAKEIFERSPREIAQCVDFPSITTLRMRAKAISEVARVVGQGGRRHATNLKGAGSTDVRALRFGEKFELDQVYLSIFSSGDGVIRAKTIDSNEVTEALEDNEVRRCWLHVILDVATREVLGWVLSETADADHSRALLRMATRDKTKEKNRYGCKQDPAPAVWPGLALADNGTATRNAGVYAGQLGMGMTVMTGRAYHATDKPYIERLFDTLEGQVLNFRPGYAGRSPGDLTGYDPKPSAEISHDDLYGMITRYCVDEYPFQPHRGTGMFGATPRQKREDALKRYGPIEAPSQRNRCLHLGVTVQASTTSEGVKAFNIPFNSTDLQRFAGGAPKRVTVHLDPDDLRKVFVSAEGLDTLMEARLSMTVFQDQSLEEAIDMMEGAAKNNPNIRILHAAHLSEARARRARESKFFADSRDPSNYQTIAQLERRADKLLQVEHRPNTYTNATVMPGHIMKRGSPSGGVPSRLAGGAQTEPSLSPAPLSDSSQNEGPLDRKDARLDVKAAVTDTVDVKNMTFGPIKDSKL